MLNFMQTNSDNTDQTPHSLAFDLGILCLPIFHKKNTSVLRVKTNMASFIWHKLVHKTLEIFFIK